MTLLLANTRNALDLNVQKSINTLHFDLLHLQDGDIRALKSFIKSWTAFDNLVQSCSDSLQEETLNMIFAFSNIVSTHASSMVELDIEFNQHSKYFLTIVEEMRGLIITEGVHDQVSDAIAYPSYIEPSYRWLLNNLHSPYPSKETRIAISTETNCLRKDIDNWFIDARKRIGWNALRRARFLNSRAGIIDAATRFFVKEDPKRPLTSDIEFEFASIQTKANDLYSEKFSESTLATKLDVAVKDMTPEVKAQAAVEEKRRKLVEKERKKAERKLQSYPSPEPSPERSPKRSPHVLLARDLPEEDDAASVTRSNRKRSRSVDLSDSEDGPHCNRSNKRIRTDESSFVSGLPSPAPSAVEESVATPEPSSLGTTDDIPVTTLSSTSSRKRKRELSESDGQSELKRLRGVLGPPHLQMALNPDIMPDYVFQGTTFGEFLELDLSSNLVPVDCLDPLEEYDIDLGFGFFSVAPSPTPKDTQEDHLFPSWFAVPGPSADVSNSDHSSWYSSSESSGLYSENETDLGPCEQQLNTPLVDCGAPTTQAPQQSSPKHSVSRIDNPYITSCYDPSPDTSCSIPHLLQLGEDEMSSFLNDFLPAVSNE